LNGGDFEEGVLNPASYRYTEAVVLSQPAIRSDYEFKGWYGNATLEGESFTKIPTLSTGDKTFYARWDPRAPITITLQAVPSNPLLESVTVTIGDRNPPRFTVEAEYTDYAWYWDGDPIEEETEASYILSSYGPPGIYELSVVVTDEGRKLSARCLVTIMAE
jgi:uncharacterized repeat protein (TIGR02543 family)